jgi:O-antigen/teichoic acid export membrane protein
MENGRVKNSLRNMKYGAINRLVSIFFPFVVRTIFIRTIGEEYLGLNTLYASILQVLNLADLGFSSAITASMYKPIAENDTEKICALTKLYRDIYRVIGSIILAVGLIITPFVDKLIKGVPPEGINIYTLWLMYLTNTVVSYLLFAYKVSLLNAHQRNDITEKIGALARIITSILQIYVVAVLNSVYLYVALTVCCSIAYNIWCAYACNKMYPMYVCKGSIDKSTKREISRNIGALTIQKVGQTVSLSLDSIVISAFLGLTTVTIYGNYNYVISAISAFVALTYSAITASIGNSIAAETPEKNYKNLKQIFFFNTWLIGWCCICFMCIFQDFMTVWMGENLLLGISTIFCLVLRFYFEQLRKVVLTYKDAAGMWWADKWRPLVGCTVNLILNIILVKMIGVAGVALSTVISYVLVEMPWETHVLFRIYFKCSAVNYYKEMMLSMVTSLIAGIITFWLCNTISVSHIMGIVVKLIICLIVPNVIFIVLSIKNPYFADSKELAIKIKNMILKSHVET